MGSELSCTPGKRGGGERGSESERTPVIIVNKGSFRHTGSLPRSRFLDVTQSSPKIQEEMKKRRETRVGRGISHNAIISQMGNA